GADGDRSPTGEIAGRDDPGAVVHAGGVIPVGHGGQRLAAELGERRSLVPADSCDRVILLAGRVLARFPGRRPVPARPVGHSSHPPLRLGESSTLSSGVIPSSTQPESCAAYSFRHTAAPGGLVCKFTRRANLGRSARKSESRGFAASTRRASV